jgi:outer membrane protein assembly factor BamB
MSSRVLLCVSSFLVVTLQAEQAQWPDFRGPGAQGQAMAVGLPTTWSVTSNIAWRRAIEGRAWSTPIVAEGKLFLTNAKPLDATGKSVALTAIALDPATGSQLWETEIFRIDNPDALKMHKKNSHASPSPVYEDGKLYLHFSHHGSACIDVAGKVIWNTQANSYAPVHGTGGSPQLVGDLMIFNADAKENPAVLALDKATGALRWRSERQSNATRKFSFSTPLLIEVAGQPQVITAGSGFVQALDPKDGSEIWHVNYGQGYSVVPRPIYAHGLIFVSSGYDKAVAYAIRPDGKGDVTASHVAWTLTKQVPLNPSMVVVGENLYMVSDAGLLSCVDAKTGRVHYSERILGPCSSSLLAAGDMIYAIDELGTTAVIKAGNTLQVVAKNILGEKTQASMATCENDLIIRTEQAVYRVHAPQASE